MYKSQSVPVPSVEPYNQIDSQVIAYPKSESPRYSAPTPRSPSVPFQLPVYHDIDNIDLNDISPDLKNKPLKSSIDEKCDPEPSTSAGSSHPSQISRESTKFSYFMCSNFYPNNLQYLVTFKKKIKNGIRGQLIANKVGALALNINRYNALTQISFDRFKGDPEKLKKFVSKQVIEIGGDEHVIENEIIYIYDAWFYTHDEQPFPHRVRYNETFHYGANRAFREANNGPWNWSI